MNNSDEPATNVNKSTSDLSVYYIGPMTFRHVFQQHQIYNMADMQAVMDAVEAALKNFSESD